jgi:hypothetical protein
MGIEPAVVPIVPTLVDYSTGAMTLDMRGTEPIPGRSRVTEVGETLVLDANGMLRVYNELDGKPEYERREAALRNRVSPAGPPGAPGDPGLPGGGGLEGF